MGTTREFLVGLVFFGLLLLLGIFTIVLTDVRIGPEPPSLMIHFRNTEGLEEGDEVWINGFRSGRVAQVREDRESDRLAVKIYFEREPRLYGDATFRIKPATPLGGKILAIDRGLPRRLRTSPEGRRRPEYLDMKGQHEGQAQADVLTVAGQLIEENRAPMQELLVNLAATSKEVREQVPDAMRHLRETLRNMQAITTAIDSGEGLIGRVLRDSTTADRLDSIVARLDRITASLEQGEGTLGALLTDPTMRDDVGASLAALRRLTEGIEQGEGTLGMLANDPELYREMVGLMRDVRTVTAKITPERGIGKFLTEDAPWDRLNTTLDRLDQLVAHVNDAVRTPDNLVGFALSDEEPVLLIRRSLKTFHELMEDTRENAPIATFAGFLFRAF
jgi:phospholipid/cholesterol/gamma-HCH transport system substrate-binding protein